MKFTFAALSALVATALAGPVIIPRAPRGTPDPDQVWIDTVTYGGSGCPQGSASVDILSDRKSFQIILQEYIASAGPGISLTQSRKNCQISVQLHYPGGFQYSVFSTDYRGYANLAKDVKGTQKATYYFSGETKQASTESTFTGPKIGDYLIHDEIPFTSTVWSPCGRYAALSINSQVRIDNARNNKEESILTTDSVDGQVIFKVGIQWQECKK